MQQVPLPEFDPFNSAVAWFRDYAAYCGVSDDGKKASAIVAQLGSRKQLLKKSLGDSSTAAPEFRLSAPLWQRSPSRVTFDPKNEPKFTFTAPTHAVDAVPEEQKTAEEEQRKSGRTY